MIASHFASLRVSVVAGLMLSLLGATEVASATPLTLTYDSFLESKTIGSPLMSGGNIRLDGRLRDVDDTAINNSLLFTAGSSALALSASWLVAPAENRTQGVNIDLLDSTNTVLASDSFLGLTGTVAQSRLIASGLITGATYKLLFTGTAQQAGRYQLDLVNGATPPPLTTLAAATPAANHVLFDTHKGAKTLGKSVASGTQVRIDGVLPDDQLAAISNEILFLLSGDTLSAGIEWIVGLNDPRRTLGVNVDLIDSGGHVVASDQFQGIVDDQAFSRFVATGLAPGQYRLVLTGNAFLGGRYQIDLGTDASLPVFRAINDAPPLEVPEPASWQLMALALVLLGITVGTRASRLSHEIQRIPRLNETP